MTAEYDINLSNGNVLATLYPLETNGPDNSSTPRLIQDVRPQQPIDAVNTATETFSVVGDLVNIFRVGQLFEVIGSTGNNGTYTVQSSSFGTGSTHIIVDEDITDVTADGDIIVHVFVLNGTVAYRFIPTFVFDVQESSGPLITGVDTGLETFTVAGDYSFYFLNNVTFDIVGSTGNDGTYTTSSSAFAGGETTITVAEDITDATIDGKIDGLINGSYTVTALGAVINGATTIIPVTHGSIRDNTINSMGLPYGQIQYTINDTNTPLKLPGKSTLNYGEKIVENLVRMTEHFANDLAPELNTNIGSTPAGSPLKGQLWYKTLNNEEGFLYHNGTSWSNQWDFDNGILILRDPQNTTTANSDIYLTGDETQLPAGYLGTDESGMVIWNEVDPVAQDAILRVMSVDGTENLRVEHDGYIRTANNLEVLGGGNGTVESYFHGKVGIGDNGLPTVERTLTVEGNGIAVNSDTNFNAGLILDCPSITEQSIIEFEVANTLISSIHTETNVSTVWESQAQLVDNADVSTLILRGGIAPVGGTAGGIDITGGTCASGSGSGGDINILAGNTITIGSIPGNILIISGESAEVTGTTTVRSAVSNGTNAGSGTGIVTIQSGDIVHGAGGQQPGITGKVIITSGESDKSSTGDIEISSGLSTLYGNTGNVLVTTGITGAGAYTPGIITIVPGIPSASGTLDGSNVNITGGDSGGTGAAKGGDIVLTTTGNGIGGAVDGIINIVGNTSTTGNVGINVIPPTGNVDLEVAGDVKTGTVFLGGNGAITAPTYSFTNDPNSGIFSAAADQLGFVVNGTNVFNVEADGTLSVNTATYETLVTVDNDIPNKKYVDDIIHPQYEEYSATGGEVIVNTTIPTIANTGSPGIATLQVFLNGLFQIEGGTKAYTVTGTTQITFNVALIAADDVVIYSFNK